MTDWASHNHRAVLAAEQWLAALALLDEPNESSDNDIRIIKLLEGLSESYWKQVAKYAQAEPVCERLLKLAISRLGLDHPDSAAAVNNLGLVLLRQEKYAKAASSFSQALALYRK